MSANRTPIMHAYVVYCMHAEIFIAQTDKIHVHGLFPVLMMNSFLDEFRRKR